MPNTIVALLGRLNRIGRIERISKIVELPLKPADGLILAYGPNKRQFTLGVIRDIIGVHLATLKREQAGTEKKACLIPGKLDQPGGTGSYSPSLVRKSGDARDPHTIFSFADLVA
jgi:hypothetical protein